MAVNTTGTTDLQEILPYTQSELEREVKSILLSKGLTDILYPGSNISQLSDVMTYLVHVLNTNTAINLQEVLLPLASKRMNILFGARQLGYEATQQTSYRYNVKVKALKNPKYEDDDSTHYFSVYINKYDTFEVEGVKYVYMGAQGETLEIKTTNQEIYDDIDASYVEITLKQGEVKSYKDDPLLSFRAFAIENDSGEIEVKQDYLIPFKDVEESGIELYLSYIDNNGVTYTHQPWVRADHFIVDSSYSFQKQRFMRLQNIYLQVPTVWFEIAGFGNAVGLNTLIEATIVITEGKAGEAKSEFIPTGNLDGLVECYTNYIEHYGTDVESNDSVKENAGVFHNAANRLVTALDYIALSQRHSSVKYAKCWGAEDETEKDGINPYGIVYLSYTPERTQRDFESHILDNDLDSAPEDDADKDSQNQQYDLMNMPRYPLLSLDQNAVSPFVTGLVGEYPTDMIVGDNFISTWKSTVDVNPFTGDGYLFTTGDLISKTINPANILKWDDVSNVWFITTIEADWNIVAEDAKPAAESAYPSSSTNLQHTYEWKIIGADETTGFTFTDGDLDTFSIYNDDYLTLEANTATWTIKYSKGNWKPQIVGGEYPVNGGVIDARTLETWIVANTGNGYAFTTGNLIGEIAKNNDKLIWDGAAWILERSLGEFDSSENLYPDTDENTVNNSYWTPENGMSEYTWTGGDLIGIKTDETADSVVYENGTWIVSQDPDEIQRLARRGQLDNWYLNYITEIDYMTNPSTNPDENSLFTYLEPFKFMSILNTYRQPTYLNFDFNVKIIKYDLSVTKAETNQKVFDVIDTYFYDYIEFFESEFFISNLQSKVDATLSETSGIEIDLHTYITLHKVMYDVLKVETQGDYYCTFTKLAYPFDGIYNDTDGWLLQEGWATEADPGYTDINYLPQINTTDFYRVSTGLNTYEGYDLYCDLEMRWGDSGDTTPPPPLNTIDAPRGNKSDRIIWFPIRLGVAGSAENPGLRNTDPAKDPGISVPINAGANSDPIVGYYFIRNEFIQDIEMQLFYAGDPQNPIVPVNITYGGAGELAPLWEDDNLQAMVSMVLVEDNVFWDDNGYGYVKLVYPGLDGLPGENIPATQNTMPRLRQVKFK